MMRLLLNWLCDLPTRARIALLRLQARLLRWLARRL